MPGRWHDGPGDRELITAHSLVAPFLIACRVLLLQVTHRARQWCAFPNTAKLPPTEAHRVREECQRGREIKRARGTSVIIGPPGLVWGGGQFYNRTVWKEWRGVWRAISGQSTKERSKNTINTAWGSLAGTASSHGCLRNSIQAIGNRYVRKLGEALQARPICKARTRGTLNRGRAAKREQTSARRGSSHWTDPRQGCACTEGWQCKSQACLTELSFSLSSILSQHLPWPTTGLPYRAAAGPFSTRPDSGYEE
jgi:hypothetical protein